MKKFLIAIWAALAALPVWAHGGEDHGDAPAAPQAQIGQAPRAVAQTEEFELVAVLTGGGEGGASGESGTQAAPVLTLYLDRFATNQPIADATIEVESGAFKAVAKPLAPGVYAVPGDAFGKPGRYPLTVSVQAGDSSDLLDAALEYGAPAAAADPATPASRLRWAWGLGLVLLAFGGLVALARRGDRHQYRHP